jgi:(2Fe-2S) ferredoxin
MCGQSDAVIEQPAMQTQEDRTAKEIEIERRAAADADRRLPIHEGAPTIRVCQGKSCGPKGGPLILRDLEELATGIAHVEYSDCLGLCGRGPNVQVLLPGQTPYREMGNKSFDHVIKLVQATTPTPLSRLRLEVGRLKFAVRRDSRPIVRNVLLEQAFALLPEEKEELCSQPDFDKLRAEVHALRAQDRARRCFEEPAAGFDRIWSHVHIQYSAANPLQALYACTTGDDAAQGAYSDAKRASVLAPDWPQAWRVLSIACEANSLLPEALLHLKAADSLGADGLNDEALRLHLMRLEKGLGWEHAQFRERTAREEPLHECCVGNHEYRAAGGEDVWYTSMASALSKKMAGILW